MKNLKVIVTMSNVGSCSGSACPTIFEDDMGNYYFQGKVVSNNEKKKLNIPKDEDIVLIPNELIKEFVNNTQNLQERSIL